MALFDTFTTRYSHPDMKFKFSDQFQCMKHFFSKMFWKWIKGALPTSVGPERCLSHICLLLSLICGKKKTIIPIWFNPMETNFTFKSWFNTAWFFNEKTLLDLNGQRSQLYLFKPSCECCLWTVKLPAKIISSVMELLLWWVKIS